ncbi:M23 family metallopeptidase [Microbacterium pumilum]|uniref:M23ase beta-sheet core domain-containing protein n=1 Tax=Microbacterium pumilum TaxID=344165 RepID=A0ABN2SQI5_9MICO
MARNDGYRRSLTARLAATGGILLVLVGGVVAAQPADAHLRADDAVTPAADLSDRGWRWPVGSFRLENPYRAPAHRFGPGHRGVDLRPLSGLQLLSPASGVVAFSGMVAGRGILTIDHGDGLVTTLEPIQSSLAPGTPVGAGDVVGELSLGGHTMSGAVHFGVRLDGEYINPLLLLGGVPRAVLLPCC